MNYRKLGKTGLTVSEVGFGAWGIGKSGWIGASDDESVKALHRSALRLSVLKQVGGWTMGALMNLHTMLALARI
jgi:hypothetical protein